LQQTDCHIFGPYESSHPSHFVSVHQTCLSDPRSRFSVQSEKIQKKRFTMANKSYLTPYFCLYLKLYLTIGVSIAGCERSFSMFKFIKYYLRSTMGESRLSTLAILSFESEFIEKLDFGDIIYNFASTKAQRAQLE